jgi:hypothetical protein
MKCIRLIFDTCYVVYTTYRYLLDDIITSMNTSNYVSIIEYIYECIRKACINTHDMNTHGM